MQETGKKNSVVIKEKNKKITSVIIIATFGFLFIRMFLVRFYTDPLTGFYDEKANIFVKGFDYVIALVIIALFFSQFFLYKKNNSVEIVDTFVQGSQTLIFSSSLIAFLMLAAAFMQGLELLSNYSNLSFVLTNMSNILEYSKNNAFDLLGIITAVPASIYFFSTAAKSSEKSDNIESGEIITKKNVESDLHNENSENNESSENTEILHNTKGNSAYVILSFFPVIWTYFRLLKCFFDMSSPVNSPTRAYEIICLVALMFYLLSESRFLTQKFYTAKFFTFAYISLILLTISSFPTIIFSSFWIFESNQLSIYYAVELAFVIYIFARLYSQIRYSSFDNEEVSEEVLSKEVLKATK